MKSILERLPTVVEATFRRAKFVGDRPYIADSTKLKFTGYKVLSRCYNFTNYFKREKILKRNWELLFQPAIQIGGPNWKYVGKFLSMGQEKPFKFKPDYQANWSP